MTYTPNLKHSVPSKIVLIGASTGGPGQIEKIINSLPKLHNSTIVIAQHMVRGFMPSFAKRLKEHTNNNVLIAENMSTLDAGNIYICNGFTAVKQQDFTLEFINKDSSNTHEYNPDINTVFNSFTPLTNKVQILCAILTGIGEDGVDACKNLSLNGVRTITENENSAIVDGMPSRARKDVPNIEVLDINTIINEIKEFCT